MEIINGKELADKIINNTTEAVASLINVPKIAIILASNDDASKVYTNLKIKKANDIGIDAELFTFKDNSTSEDLINKIEQLNENSSFTGIMVQLPLYEALDLNRIEILNAIDPLKDVDGLTSFTLGFLSSGYTEEIVLPATVDAIIESLKYALKKDLNSIQGMNVLILNNTNLIGKPLSLILSTFNATVTLANKFTTNLKELCMQADIIVSATGQTALISADMIKQNAILIDVTSIKKNERTIGDFIVSEELEKKASFLTPVPGGIGPLTIACLLRNIVKLSRIQND